MAGLTILSGNPQGSNEESEDSALKYGNPVIQNTPAPATYAAGATTNYTAADVLGGIIVDGGNGASAHTGNLPSAASLAAQMRAFSSRGVIVGDTVWCLIINGSSGAGVFTLGAGAGGSFDANQAAASRVIPQNSSKEIAIRFTNGVPGSEAYTVYS